MDSEYAKHDELMKMMCLTEQCEMKGTEGGRGGDSSDEEGEPRKAKAKSRSKAKGKAKDIGNPTSAGGVREGRISKPPSQSKGKSKAKGKAAMPGPRRRSLTRRESRQRRLVSLVIRGLWV